ncbi:MAG: GntR family transcriptional regulator [Microbacteriaceae bacterium]
MLDEGKPIFLQIAERIEDDIISGALEEEAQVPSTNEFAAFHRINPATAGKGVNLLVERGILYKKRGIGMFVASGARDALVEARTEQFASEFLGPLLVEANRLGITRQRLTELLDKEKLR